ncbi:MAG: hypothetical protein ABH879_00880 [archaeon]
MNIQVVGRIEKDVRLLNEAIKKEGCTLSARPDVVISLGGDGTFLYSERKYPGTPKLILRDKSICRKCNHGRLKDLIRSVCSGNLAVDCYSKVEAKANGAKLVGANDIIIRNSRPYHALRFTLEAEGVNCDYIGDGIVAATAFGSGGYYHSITKKGFRKGMGIALNNPTVKAGPFRSDWARVRILRNRAIVCADNNPRTVTVNEGDKIIIRISKEVSRIIR